MHARFLALPFIALGSLLLGAACTVSGDGGGSLTVACVADDDACGSDDDCCSDICASDGFCGLPADSCLEDNSACSGDSDCCSAICASDGYCGLP